MIQRKKIQKCSQKNKQKEITLRKKDEREQEMEKPNLKT